MISLGKLIYTLSLALLRVNVRVYSYYKFEDTGAIILHLPLSAVCSLTTKGSTNAEQHLLLCAGAGMGSRSISFDLLPVDVVTKIFRQLEGPDLCNAASTCRDFWKYASGVDRMEIVLHGESHASSLYKFLKSHIKDGLKVVTNAALATVLSLAMNARLWSLLVLLDVILRKEFEIPCRSNA